MFVDARSLAEGETLQCDVCLVGAGASGITIARELARTDLSVIVLESGGFEYEPATQKLYDGVNAGHAYFRLGACRVRIFGGTTSHWNGWCRPLDEVDLEERDWVPDSGWPLARAELDPHYARAHELLELGPYDYSLERWGRVTSSSPLRLSQAWIESAMYQFSPPTRFGVAYREDLRRAAGVKVLLHANAVGVTLDGEGGAVSGVRVSTLAGKGFAVHARRVVLAAGGIENARLLLASNDVAPAGIGNDHDLVGRFFADHPHAPVALVGLPEDVPTALYEQRSAADGTTVRGALIGSERLCRSKGVLRFAATLDPLETDPYVDREAEAERLAEDVGEDVLRLARSVEGGSGRRLYALYMRAEQAPNRDSRVTLAGERDPLGMRRARLEWRLGELDRRSAPASVAALARALGASGLGRVYSRPLAEGDFWPRVEGGNHHLGTARMNRDPRRGVVDERCRVHGVGNLYVAGSAVFPTTGYANPTLTIVALALRLAGDLRRSFA